MELLHTAEEIIAFDKTINKAIALMDLGREYRDNDLISRATEYRNSVSQELLKYTVFVGQTALAPPSRVRGDESSFTKRPGVIVGGFQFSKVSSSVVCRFEYDAGGFDTHTLCKLVETMKL